MSDNDKENTPIPHLNPEPYQGLDQEKAEEKEKEKQRKESEGQESFSQTEEVNRATGHDRYLYGGYWRRCLAFGIDVIIVEAIDVILLSLLGMIGLKADVLSNPTFTWIMWRLCFILYFTLTTYFSNGLTVGKVVCRLQTIDAHTVKLSLTTCFLREGLGKVLLTLNPILGIVLSLSVAFSKKRQNFMDFFTDTNVVNTRQVSLVNHERNKSSMDLD